MNEILASQTIGFPILSALIALPILGVIALQFQRSEAGQRQIVLITAALELALSLVMLFQFQAGTADVQFAEYGTWMPILGAAYHLGVDGISVLFLPLTALVILLALVFSQSSGAGFGRFYLSNLLIFEALTMGIFASLDLLMFFVFWELILIPSYFLIRLWGVGPQRHYAAIKYVVYMLVGSAPLLIAIAMLGSNYAVAVAAGTAPAGQAFNYIELMKVAVAPETQATIFLMMMLAFAVKGPVPPFHTWMPTVLMEGPIGMAILLVGLKLGTYGMLRFVLPLVPDAAVAWAPVMTWLGVFAILYGGLIALAQTNLRRLLAFASVSHVGLVLLGLFALEAQGLQGSLFMMINIGLTSTVLMFLTGIIYRRTGSSELGAMGGVARHVPKLAFFFFAIGLATIGTPGTSGFVAEFSVMWGAFEADWRLAAVAVLGVILSAGYFLWYYERAFFGPVTSPRVSTMKDLTARETGAMTVALALVLAMGIWPMPLVGITSASTQALADRLATAQLAAASGSGDVIKVAQAD
jgi:NADH-quinone oxidoreductase subunit M